VTPAIALGMLVVFGASAMAGAACGPDDAGAPRVGLVLSGGGARGLAHVGVLAVLEEEGIAVDCVTGTSMGAAIGALWASGYSAAQISEIVRSVDWQEVFSGRRVRPLIPLSRRLEDVSPALRVRLEGFRPRLPPALASDYRMNRLLIKLLTEPGLRAQGRFERLPKPFRTVATDLGTLQPVVFTEGSLPRAVRASLSAPVMLPPIEVDGRVLVDGGIVDNLPVDIARALGADVVIAVDAALPPMKPEEWDDVVGVGRQLVEALMREHSRKWVQPADVVVTPQFPGRGFVDYSDPARLIEAGRAAARAALARLREVAPRRGEPAVPVAPSSAPAVAEVVVRGNRRVATRSVLAAFGIDPPAPFDTERLVRGLDRVWATGLFETVWVDVETAPGGVRVVLAVREAPPAVLEIGSAYDEADQVNAFTRVRHRNLFGHGERIDLTLLGGARESGARVALLGDGLWRRAFGYVVGAQLLDERPVVYQDGEEIGRAAFTRELGTVGAQAAFGPDVLVQARLDAGRVRSARRPGLGLRSGTDAYRMLRGLVAWDRLDDRDLPEAGLAVSIRADRSLHRLSGVRDYWRVRGDARAAWSAGGWILEAAALAGLSDGDVPAYDLHRLGGPRLLPGHPRDELWGRQAAGVAASLGREIRGLRISLEGGGGNVWDRPEDVSLGELRWGMGLGVAYRTPLGPVLLQAGIDEEGRHAFYISTGRR
jgi:NTE family protein